MHRPEKRGCDFRSGRSSNLRREVSVEDMILPPRALDDLDSFSEILRADRVGVFSDFDGTLTPLFDDYRDTVLSPAIRDRLSELSRKVELVAVVSGRDVRYLRETIGLKSVTYVGNHGLEEWRAREKQPEYRAQVPVGLVEEVESGVGAYWDLGVIGGEQGASGGGSLPQRARPRSGAVCGVANVGALGHKAAVWESRKARWSGRSDHGWR